MAKKKNLATVTIKINRDGTQTITSTGGYDLRKLFQPREAEPVGIQHHPLCSIHTGKQGHRCDYDCARDYPQSASSSLVDTLSKE